jgi:hypothetical protein
MSQCWRKIAISLIDGALSVMALVTFENLNSGFPVTQGSLCGILPWFLAKEVL